MVFLTWGYSHSYCMAAWPCIMCLKGMGSVRIYFLTFYFKPGFNEKNSIIFILILISIRWGSLGVLEPVLLQRQAEKK